MKKDHLESSSSKSTRINQQKQERKFVEVLITIVAGAVVAYGIFTNLSRYLTQKSLQDQSVNQQSLEEEAEAEMDLSEEIMLSTDEATFSAGPQLSKVDIQDVIPLYPDTEIESTVTTDSGSVTEQRSSDTLSDVVKYYEQNLIDTGWSIATRTDITNATVFGISKNDFEGAVIINEEEDGTHITIDINEI